MTDTKTKLSARIKDAEILCASSFYYYSLLHIEVIWLHCETVEMDEGVSRVLEIRCSLRVLLMVALSWLIS